MKWTYSLPAALVISVVGLASGCSSSSSSSTSANADAVCAKIAAKCTGQSASDCTSSFNTFHGRCPTQADALLSCASNAQITCGTTAQEDTFTGCDSQFQALIACVIGDAGLGGAGGGTSTGGSGGSHAGGSSAGGTHAGGAGGAGGAH